MRHVHCDNYCIVGTEALELSAKGAPRSELLHRDASWVTTSGQKRGARVIMKEDDGHAALPQGELSEMTDQVDAIVISETCRDACYRNSGMRNWHATVATQLTL